MKISDDEIKKALKIRNAVQHYLEMAKKVNIRSTDVFPYLVRKGIFEADKNNGLFFRRFLKKLYKANMLHSLIPQCTYVPGINGEIFGEWYFNSHIPKIKEDIEEGDVQKNLNAGELKDISFEDAKENLFKLIEGKNPITGKLIDQTEDPILFEISQSLKVFIENEPDEDRAFSNAEVRIASTEDEEINKSPNSKISDLKQKKSKPAYSIDKIRKSYENAYKPWSSEEENLLIQLYNQDFTIKEIAQKLKRQNGAIKSRLRKLGLIK
ncbi:hypothetical protein C7S20_18300 [Christiangramia fulva]|uniref:Uncharacterized protein n=1 Tax=Christiangramia fulva TaxID=2126553 RepID=A0A2R3Z9U8_9FLAO|nr:hypothetical protein [Christiangramia fulva]AVR47040.1 hypothetical protein C7S20_18300 [Christiangramia fulva]